MAKLRSNIKFSGALGDLVGSKRHDQDGFIVQSKGGPSKDQIKNSPNFARTRENNFEFGGISAAVKQLRRSINVLLGCADSMATSRFTKLCKSLQLADNQSPRGQRSILFSRFGKWLNDFELNRNAALTSVIKIQEFSVSRETASARIVIPELLPGVNFSNPWKQPNYRIIATLSALPDMVYAKEGYVPADPSIENHFTSTSFKTPVLNSNLVFEGVTIDLHINDLSPGDSVSFLLAVGIEFVTEQPIGMVPVKRAACGKILGIF